MRNFSNVIPWCWICVVGCEVLLLIARPLHLRAQTAGSFATISGAVVDPEGKVVPDAAVNAKNDLNGAVRSTTTDAEGRFSVTSLAVGTYTLEVSAPGFATARSTSLQLAANGLENISI